MTEVVEYEKGSNYAELNDLKSPFPQFNGNYNQSLMAWTYNHEDLSTEKELALYLPTVYKDVKFPPDQASYEKGSNYSEIKQDSESIDFWTIIKKEGVKIKELPNNRVLYYIPSLDFFLKSVSDERDECLFIENVLESHAKKYREELKLNNNTN